MDAAFLGSAGIWPYLALFALSAGETSAFLGFAVPGETFVIAAGVFASGGDLSLAWLIPVVIVGAAVGDSIGYALGRRLASGRARGRWAKAFSGSRMARVNRFFERWGPATVFLGRFTGFVRPLAPFAAGAARMHYRRFLFFDLAGAIIWGAGTLLIGYVVGAGAEGVIRSVGLWGGAAIAAVAIIGFVVYRRRRSVRARAGAAGTEPASDTPAEDAA